MIITRRQLVSIIKKSIILESRKMKQQFYDQVRSRYPDIDRAYFVHWIMNRENKWEELADRLTHIAEGTGYEYSANLVDPSGGIVEPHFGDFGAWGPIGIVFQGIPTFGRALDSSTDNMETASGTRRYPGEVSLSQQDVNLKGEPTDYYKTGYPQVDDIDYDVSSNLEFATPSRKVMDLTLAEPFVTHQPNFGYSGSEFTVVPKKVAAVVYLPEYDRFPDRTKEELTKSFQTFRMPHVVGKNQVSELYRSLYNR